VLTAAVIHENEHPLLLETSMAGSQHQSGSSDGKNPGRQTAHRDPPDSRVNGPRGGVEALTKEGIPEVKQPPRYPLDSRLNGPRRGLAVLTKDEVLFVPGIEPVSGPKLFAVTAAPQFTAVFEVI
jgi:hypothetical protein